jgi:hypothetical protein
MPAAPARARCAVVCRAELRWSSYARQSRRHQRPTSRKRTSSSAAIRSSSSFALQDQFARYEPCNRLQISCWIKFAETLDGISAVFGEILSNGFEERLRKFIAASLATAAATISSQKPAIGTMISSCRRLRWVNGWPIRFRFGHRGSGRRHWRHVGDRSRRTTLGRAAHVSDSLRHGNLRGSRMYVLYSLYSHAARNRLLQ